jgi:Zn-dependent protease with chaperone function
MIKGRYFEADSARASPAILSIADGRAIIQVDGRSDKIEARVETVGARLGAVPRRIELVGGAVFEAPHDADLGSISGRETRALDRIAGLERSWKFAAAAVVMTVLLVVGFFRYGLPAMAYAAAKATPNNVSTLINTGALDTVDRTLLGQSTLAQSEQARVKKLFDELAANADTGGLPLTLVFRDSSTIGPNAFALPGGTIIMTDQLVEIAKTDDEIAGVIAHEIGHVEQKHSLQMLYRVAGMALMVAAIAGDGGQVVDQIVTQASALGQLSYSREFEDQADKRSVELMVKAKRDPIAFVGLLDRIVSEATGVEPGEKAGEQGGEKEQSQNWFSTHPDNENRRAAVEAYAKSLGWNP